MKNIYLFILFSTTCNTVYAMEKPRDLRVECNAVLTTPCVYPECQVAQKPISDTTKKVAAKLSGLLEDAVGKVFWKDSEESSDSRKRWRALTINTISLSVYMHVLNNAHKPAIGLTDERVAIVSGLAKQTEVFLSDYCKKRPQLQERNADQLFEPADNLAKLAVEKFSTPDAEQQERLTELSSAIVAWGSANFLTPQAIMNVIRIALKTPTAPVVPVTPGAPPKVNEAPARILKRYPKECKELGQLVLESVKHICSHSLATGKLLPNLGELFISEGEIGSQILAAVEDILIDEDSMAIPLAERIVKALSEETVALPDPMQQQQEMSEEEAIKLQTDLKKALDAALRVEFKALLDARLPGLISSLMVKKTGDNFFVKAVKAVAEKPVIFMLNKMKPLLIDLVCDDQAKGAQHLAFHYLPTVFQGQLKSLTVSQRPLDAESAKLSTGLGEVAHSVAQSYLWHEEESALGFRRIFVDTIRATTEQIAYLLLTSPKEENPNLSAIRTARTLTMLHIFLEEYRAIRAKEPGANFSVTLDKDLNQPLIDLTTHIMQMRFPGEPDLHARVNALMRQGSDTFFQTILDPVTITNLISNFDFPVPGATAPRAATSSSSSSKADVWVHAPLGKAVIRCLRSFLSLSGQLGALNAFFVGVANHWHEKVGENMINGDPGDYVKSLRSLLFKQGGDEAGAARPFVNWVQGEALKQKFHTWIHTKLKPFIEAQIEMLAPFGTKTIASKLVGGVVPSLIGELESLLWSPNQEPLKILLYYYILPVWRDDIVAAAKLPKPQ